MLGLNPCYLNSNPKFSKSQPIYNPENIFVLHKHCSKLHPKYLQITT